MRFFVFLFCTVLFSCNPGNESEQNNGNVNENSPVAIPKGIGGCYESIYGKDYSKLHLEIVQPDSVTGTLSIHYFEKDNADGAFTGVIIDDKLVGWYNFHSEGKNSVRQMVFKISGDSLVEGYGDIEMMHDTAVFKDISGLNYLSQRPLTKIPCR